MTSMFALWTGALLAFGGPVTEVAITPSAERTDVLIAVDGDVEYRDFTMEGPYRLVVDLMGARHALPRDEFVDVNRGGVLSVRASQYSEDIVRVVLVLDHKADYTVASDSRGVRISLGNGGGDFAPWSSGLAAVPVRQPEPRNLGERRQQVAPVLARSTARRISISFTNSPMHDVLLAFASFSGKSIVPGSNVSGLVTATINEQPWDIALRTLLSAYGLVAEEDDYGIIRVDNINDLNQREEVEAIITQAHRINYATATELQTAIQPLLTERGSITVGQGTNTLVVSDINRVQIHPGQDRLREPDGSGRDGGDLRTEGLPREPVQRGLLGGSRPELRRRAHP